MRIGAITLGALVIGCVVAMDPSGWSPFGPAKWLVVSTLGFAGGAMLLWRRRARLDRPTRMLWLVLVGLFTVSALSNGDVLTAIFGHPDRHLGVVTWVMLWLLFSAGQLLDPRGQRVVIVAAALAACLMGAYATIELVVGRPIDIAVESQRLGGPFGSASFLGAAACLTLPLAVGVALDGRHSRWVRGAFAIGVCLAAVALIGSGARAAWVGIGVAGALAVIVGRSTTGTEPAPGQVPQRTRVDRRSVAGLVLFSAVVVVIGAALVPRLDDVLQRDNGSASRLDEWQVALRVIGDHPISGVGPEGYRIAVAEGIDSNYERTYGRLRTQPDRAHSAPLDIALAGGVPAALAWFGLVGFVLRRAVRLLRHGDALGRCLAVAVIGYAVQQAFMFPLSEVDPVWWLFCGMVVTAGRPISPVNARAPTPVLDAGSRWTGLVTTTVAGTAMAAACVAMVAGVFDVAADRLTRSALSTAAAGNLAPAIEDAERALNLRPDVIRYRLVAADLHLRRGTLADIDAALAHARSALRWSPDDPLAGDQLGIALLQRAIVTGMPGDVAAAYRTWRELVDRDPNRARWQFQLGRAAALAGDSDAARAAWSLTVSLNPDDTAAQTLLDELADRG